MLEKEAAKYERRDLNPRAMLWSAFGLGTLLIAVFVCIHFFEAALARHYPTIAIPRVEAPPPHLQTNPSRDLAELRTIAEARLHSYGWVDRAAGVIHIPIERAIELTAERGLPARRDPQGDAP